MVIGLYRALYFSKNSLFTFLFHLREDLYSLHLEMYNMFRLLLTIGKNPFLSFEALYDLRQINDKELPHAI